jgi:uncharacterized protein (DUF2236 family)
LWVAACIYRGIDDVHRAIFGPPAPAFADATYRHAARLATTLQVPPGMWPADRAAFEEYWTREVALIAMDDVTRDYLWDFSGLGFLPFPIRQLFGRFHRVLTAGFLTEPFRRELGLPWGRREQRIFAVTMRILRALNAITPRRLRTLPVDFYLWDMRRRIRAGKQVL